MSFSVVHATNGNSTSVTIPSTTAGNTLVVVIGSFGGSSPSSVSAVKLGGAADNFAQALTQQEQSGYYETLFIWVDPDCAGGQTSVTITGSNLGLGSGPLNGGGVTVYEVSGTLSVSPVDKYATAGGTASSWSSGSTGTTTAASEIWFGACIGEAAVTGPASGWTNTRPSGNFLVSGYQVVSSTGTASYAGTGTGGDPWAAGVLTLLPAAPAVTSSGGLALPPMGFTGTAAGGNTTSSGGLALPPMGLGGAGSPPDATGGLGLAPMAMSGTGSIGYPFPATPLGLKVELLINGTWEDITTFVYERDDIVTGRGRPDESQGVVPSKCTLTLNNRDGRFSPGNPNGAYSPFLTRNVQLRVSLVTWSAALVQYEGYRFWGEVASWALEWDPTGTDIVAKVTAAGPLRRYSQGNGTIGSALRRYYTRLSGDYAPYGYWPAEDASGADEIASALPGVAAMGFTGTPSFSSDSSFGGSDAIPSVAGSTWHGQTEAASNPPGTGSLSEDTAGTFTWTCPPGVSSVDLTQVTGAGGGGGAPGPTAGGGGGGGGGTSSNSSVGVTAGTTYSYAVGAGGQAGTTQGTQGTQGGDSYFTGDTVTVTGGGGQPGLGGDTSAGGAGGTGTYAGGAGGDGSASQTTSGSLYLAGSTGGSGVSSGGTAGQLSQDWAAPAGVTTADVSAGGGAGGGEGGGAFGAGFGGGGGGGGGFASGTIDTTPGSSYTFYAGSGGGGGASGQPGQAGAASSVSGDSSTSVSASGGGAGSGSGSAGAAGSPGGSSGGSGSNGGTGAIGGGGGGGGGGGDSGTGAAASGRTPGGGGGNGAGGGWGATNSGAGGATAGGTGQAGVPGYSGGGGGGGGGAVTSSSGKAAGGGGAGWIQWSWSYTGPTGGGGGSSAGPASAGNAGNIDGTGGAAVTGGGAGGNDGSAGVSPGGGGGGGIPVNAVIPTVTPPGRGAPGLVAFSWSGGTVSPVAADIVRFLLDVDAAGGTQPSYSFTATHASPCVFTATGSAYSNGTPVQLSGGSLPGGFSAATTYYVVSASGATFELAATSGGTAINSSGTGSGNVQSTAGWVVARAVTYGTVAHLDVVYSTGGGLELIGYSSGGSVLFDSGSQAFGLDGTPVMVSAELTANSTGGAAWKLTAIEPGGGSAIATYTGTVSSVSVGYVSDWYVAPDADVTFASVGHMTAQTYAPDITVMAPVIAGYAGELAADRLERLAGEEGLTFTLVGADTDTPQMGPQADDTLVNVLQACEDLDRGQLFEPRDSFGIAYRTRVSMQGQDPVLTLDYSLAQLAGSLLPVADDQYTRNDITVTRNNGSSATAVLTSGAMSIQAPPNGVGDYAYPLTVYAYADSQLANLAAWMLTVGTVADDRYSPITVDLARSAVTSLFSTIAGVDVGDYIQVVNPPPWLTAAPISQLAWGVTETLNGFKWTIDFNAVPQSPYAEGNPPAW